MSETNTKAPHCPRCFRTDCAHPAAWAAFSDCDCYSEDCSHALACRKAYTECSGYAEAVLPAMVADLATLRNRLRWVPVGERNPTAVDCDPYGRVLINDSRYPNFSDHGTLSADGEWVHWNTGEKARPTHWFPLPAAPEVPQ